MVWVSKLSAQTSFSPYVSEDGTISVPDDFRDWAFLGTWVVAGGDEEGGAAGLHNVYTQPETVSHFRATGDFPDGAVLVKELLSAKTGDMTTGHISWAGATDGWFIMVKDGKGRFANNSLWGSGWGWALFEATDPTTTVTENHEEECIPCHVPAKDNDWIYVGGYPALKR
jgi:cytochrome c